MATNYQNAKAELKQYAEEIKKECLNDIPKFRMLLNDYTDQITRRTSYPLNFQEQNKLHNFCASLHDTHYK